MKKKAKTKNITVKYRARRLLIREAMEYQFNGAALVVVVVPGTGVVVMGKSNPQRCWNYPEGTEVKDAVSKTFREVLEEACRKWDAEKKKKKA